MAFRTWSRLPLTALGLSLLAGAGQLGIAFGFGAVRLTGAFTGVTVNQWPAQLVWVGWFAANAAVVGAVLTARLTRRDGLLAGTGRQLAVAAAAALGATVVAPLCMQPARAAELISVDPVWAVAICAILGAVVGAGAALAVLLKPPLGWNMTLVAGAVWLLALVSAAPWLTATGPLTSVRLGALEPAWLDADTAQRLALLVLPLVALLAGAVSGALARWRGHPPLVSGATGVAGPVLLAFAYLTAGPGDAMDRYQATPYYGALIAVAAGLLGSVAAALLRWPGAAKDADSRAIEPTDILRPLPDGPALPHTASPEPAAGPAGDEPETVDPAAAGLVTRRGTASGTPVQTTGRDAAPAHWDWPVPGTTTSTPARGTSPVVTAAHRFPGPDHDRATGVAQPGANDLPTIGRESPMVDGEAGRNPRLDGEAGRSREWDDAHRGGRPADTDQQYGVGLVGAPEPFVAFTPSAAPAGRNAEQVVDGSAARDRSAARTDEPDNLVAPTDEPDNLVAPTDDPDSLAARTDEQDSSAARADEQDAAAPRTTRSTGTTARTTKSSSARTTKSTAARTTKSSRSTAGTAKSNAARATKSGATAKQSMNGDDAAKQSTTGDDTAKQTTKGGEPEAAEAAPTEAAPKARRIRKPRTAPDAVGASATAAGDAPTGAVDAPTISVPTVRSGSTDRIDGGEPALVHEPAPRRRPGPRREPDPLDEWRRSRRADEAGAGVPPTPPVKPVIPAWPGPARVEPTPVTRPASVVTPTPLAPPPTTPTPVTPPAPIVPAPGAVRPTLGGEPTEPGSRARHRAPLPDLARATSRDAFASGRHAGPEGVTDAPTDHDSREASEAGTDLRGVTGAPADLDLPWASEARAGLVNGDRAERTGEPQAGQAETVDGSGRTSTASTTPAQQPDERSRGRRGLFRRNRSRPEEKDSRAVDREPEPLPARDEEFVDWVAGLGKPLPDNERESNRWSLRSTGRHHRD